MTTEKYAYYIEKIKKDLPELVNETQKKLDSSLNKKQDFAILSVFYSKLFNKVYGDDRHDGIWSTEVCNVLFADDESMSPMPESVGKQLVNMIFNIKHLEILIDLPIFEGLVLIQDFNDNPTKKDYIEFYNDIIENCDL